MKTKYMIALISAGLALGASYAHAQGTRPDVTPAPAQPDMAGQAGPGERPDVPGRPALPEDLATLRDDVMAKRAALDAARQQLIADLGQDATQEERIAALAEFHSTYAEDIAEVRVLSQELAELIRESRPFHQPVEIPDEIAAKQARLGEARAALEESRKAVLAGLGENATDEEIRAAMTQWRAENAGDIAAITALAAEVRAWFQENRPERPERPITDDMRQRRAEFQDNVAAIRENRQAYAEAMGNPDLTPAERRALTEAFRAEQRSLLQEQRELKRQQRLDGIGEGGDRRPGG